MVLGVPRHDRDKYLDWVEGKLPSVVFEVESRESEDDLESKFQVYQDDWKVDELFVFDLTEEPSLVGYRMSRGELKPIEPVNGRIVSQELGLALERHGTRLLLRDEQTGLPLLLPHQVEMEAELARLRREVESLRKK